MNKKKVQTRIIQPPRRELEKPAMGDIKKDIEKKLAEKKPILEKVLNNKYALTGIQGLDQLFKTGIPKGASSLICGGPGSGKTIFCLQTLYYAAKKGEKCFYMTFEESPERLREHMRDFGWDPAPLEKSGNLIIKKVSPLDVTRQIDAMLEKAKGELLIDIKPLIVPKGFNPTRVAIDSLSAIASAFYGKEETYRLYIEQLFNLFSEMGATSFLISETPDPTQKLTVSGVEEFLADGVIVMYNLRHGNVRESAIEILKMRGAGFEKRIVAMQIKTDAGIVVYPEQEIFTTV
jgi:circadian clock protein KaiC